MIIYRRLQTFCFGVKERTPYLMLVLFICCLTVLEVSAEKKPNAHSRQGKKRVYVAGHESSSRKVSNKKEVHTSRAAQNRKSLTQKKATKVSSSTKKSSTRSKTAKSSKITNKSASSRSAPTRKAQETRTFAKESRFQRVPVSTLSDVEVSKPHESAVSFEATPDRQSSEIKTVQNSPQQNSPLKDSSVQRLEQMAKLQVSDRELGAEMAAQVLKSEEPAEDIIPSYEEEVRELEPSVKETPMARLASTHVKSVDGGYRYLDHVGPFLKKDGNTYYEIGAGGDRMNLTLNPALQEHAEDLLAKFKVPWGAIVAIEPATGKVLALAGHSEVNKSGGQNVVSQSTFPAASLFKIITAAAAVETSGITADTNIHYRGGTYTLNKHNYLPNAKSDRVQMKLSTAMGKSCNPAFARVALNNLSVEILTQYAANFGFSKNLTIDFPVSPSTLSLRHDRYDFARTAAGFGDAYISPVHAASIAAALGNKGLMMRPYIVDSVVDRSGLIKVKKGVQVLDQIVLESTAEEVIRMMETTTTEGTGRKQFRVASPQLKKVSIAGKTGTLSGVNPKGRYYWFVAVAPLENPTLAIASLVIDNGTASINGVGLGRRFYEYYFQSESLLTSTRSQKEDKVSFHNRAKNNKRVAAAGLIPSS